MSSSPILRVFVVLALKFSGSKLLHNATFSILSKTSKHFAEALSSPISIGIVIVCRGAVSGPSGIPLVPSVCDSHTSFVKKYPKPIPLNTPKAVPSKTLSAVQFPIPVLNMINLTAIVWLLLTLSQGTWCQWRTPWFWPVQNYRCWQETWKQIPRSLIRWMSWSIPL